MLLAYRQKRRLFVSCQGLTAFTLIELLVVVAIIAVLVAILLPALASARAQASNMVCLTHSRQIGVAMLMYQSEYNGKYPHDWKDSNPDIRPPRWAASLIRAGVLANNTGILQCPKSPYKGLSDYISWRRGSWNDGRKYPYCTYIANANVMESDWGSAQLLSREYWNDSRTVLVQCQCIYLSWPTKNAWWAGICSTFGYHGLAHGGQAITLLGDGHSKVISGIKSMWETGGVSIYASNRRRVFDNCSYWPED